MLASVHVADVGARAAVGFGRRTPKAGEVDGLRHANVAFGASLSASTLPPREFGRVGLVAFWDDEAALDDFLDSHPAAEGLAGGWRLRLAPLRAHGSWPGLPPDVPTAGEVERTMRVRDRPAPGARRRRHQPPTPSQ